MPPIIEHRPDEKRPTATIWWVIAGLLSFGWFGYLYVNQPDWWALALGGFSGMMLATWAIEITGNKWPFS